MSDLHLFPFPARPQILQKPVGQATRIDDERHRRDHPFTAIGTMIRWLATIILATLLLVEAAFASDPAYPLQPVDRSSPRAALRSFLDAADALGEFLVHDYLPSPSHAGFREALRLSEIPLHGLDLSEMPAGGREKASRAAAIALYETLSRIPLPPFEAIPDAGELGPPGHDEAVRWVVPHTEIVLIRVQGGPRPGQFLFSPETVARAEEFYERVRKLPYVREVPVRNIHEIVAVGGGWMVPYSWIQSLPQTLRAPLASQAVWKWVGMALLLPLLVVLLLVAYRFSRSWDHHSPLVRALAHLAVPVSLFAATPLVAYLALVQLNFTGSVGTAIELGATAMMFVVGAWLSWRLAPVVAEAIIASPRIANEASHAHVIRVGTGLVGLIGALALLAVGADRLGVPVYGIVAGLGVGGLTIALAARASVENLIGGMSLFADKPVRVGEFCKYGDAQGTVEAIGIRSSRIRGIDRTITTIPNAVMARLPIVNYSRRDRMLFKTVLGVRCETSAEQMRYLLVRLRELLLRHPQVHPDPARVRFVGFAASSLDIEIFAYITTTKSAEFLAIQEDLLLRIIDIVEDSGVAFAFPSQTLYLGRDRLPDEAQARAAEAVVQEWRARGRLPFPDFSPEEAERFRGSLAYPPPGSPAATGGETGQTRPT